MIRSVWRANADFGLKCSFAVPATLSPKAKRQRKRSLARLIAQAEKATGKTVASATMADCTLLTFGEPEPTAATNPWLADLEKRKQ